MFIHTRGSAPKRFAKTRSLEGKNKLFVGKKRKERLLSQLNDLGLNHCNKG